MIRATDKLSDDHDLIIRMLSVLNRSLDLLELGEPVSLEIFDKTIEFVDNFIDQFHHGKEEKILFKMIEDDGCSAENDLVKTLSREHNLARNYIAKFETAVRQFSYGDEAAQQQIVENGRNFSVLLSHHIHKENTILFPLIDQILSEDDNSYLLREFEHLIDKLGGSAYEDYYNWFEGLETGQLFGLATSHGAERINATPWP